MASRKVYPVKFILHYLDKADAIAARRRAETKYGFAHQE